MVVSIISALAAIAGAGTGIASAVASKKSEEEQNAALEKAKKEDLALYKKEYRDQRMDANRNFALNQEMVNYKKERDVATDHSAGVVGMVSTLRSAAANDVGFRSLLNNIYGGKR
jgi:hypothetical protein